MTMMGMMTAESLVVAMMMMRLRVACHLHHGQVNVSGIPSVCVKLSHYFLCAKLQLQKAIVDRESSPTQNL